jgi:hypothetical protein
LELLRNHQVNRKGYDLKKNLTAGNPKQKDYIDRLFKTFDTIIREKTLSIDWNDLNDKLVYMFHFALNEPSLTESFLKQLFVRVRDLYHIQLSAIELDQFKKLIYNVTYNVTTEVLKDELNHERMQDQRVAFILQLATSQEDVSFKESNNICILDLIVMQCLLDQIQNVRQQTRTPFDKFKLENAYWIFNLFHKITRFWNDYPLQNFTDRSYEKFNFGSTFNQIVQQTECLLSYTLASCPLFGYMLVEALQGLRDLNMNFLRNRKIIVENF